MPKYVSEEPHFQRVWATYRDHTLRNAIDQVTSEGAITEGEAATAIKFLGGKNELSVN